MTHEPGTAEAASPDCLLTLALPVALEEDLIDQLLSRADWVPGFSVTQGQGMGQRIALTTSMEQVQGRARRCFIQVALGRERVQALVTELQQAVPSPQITYWVQPLWAFGRLGTSA